MLIKEKILVFIASVYLIFMVIPMVKSFIPLPPGMLNILVVISVFLLYPKSIYIKCFRWFVFFIILLYIYAIIGKDISSLGIGTVYAEKRIMIFTSYMLPPIILLGALTFIGKDAVYRAIGKLSIFIFLLSFVFIAPRISESLTYLRDSLNQNEESNGSIISYTLMHSYCLLLPPLLYGIKIHTNIRKWLIIGGVFLLSWIIIGTQITTCLIISTLFFVFFFLFNQGQPTKSILKIILFIILIWIIYASGLLLSIVDSINSFFSGTAAQSKIEDLQAMLSPNDNVDSEQSNLVGREQLHMESLRAFFSNIFIGGSMRDLGGHSFLLDMLGGLGLIGFIPFYICCKNALIIGYKYMKYPFQKAYYKLFLSGLLILLYSKGLIGMEVPYISIILVPCIFEWISEKSKDSY